MAFGGNAALIELSKIFKDEVVFNVTNTVKVYGMDFQEFIFPMGRVLFKSHPLLSRNSLYKKSMFVMDFSAFKYVTQKVARMGKSPTTFRRRMRMCVAASSRPTAVPW
jgi:hypothetical protein